MYSNLLLKLTLMRARKSYEIRKRTRSVNRKRDVRENTERGSDICASSLCVVFSFASSLKSWWVIHTFGRSLARLLEHWVRTHFSTFGLFILCIPMLQFLKCLAWHSVCCILLRFCFLTFWLYVSWLSASLPLSVPFNPHKYCRTKQTKEKEISSILMTELGPCGSFLIWWSRLNFWFLVEVLYWSRIEFGNWDNAKSLCIEIKCTQIFHTVYSECQCGARTSN